MDIEYYNYTGLNHKIIMAMLNSDEIESLIATMQTHNYICFNPIDGEGVNLCAKPDLSVSVCLHLDAAKVREITEQANGSLNYHIPAHIYIDLTTAIK
jgi:hypothetical protein